MQIHFWLGKRKFEMEIIGLALIEVAISGTDIRLLQPHAKRHRLALAFGHDAD